MKQTNTVLYQTDKQIIKFDLSEKKLLVKFLVVLFARTPFYFLQIEGKIL